MKFFRPTKAPAKKHHISASIERLEPRQLLAAQPVISEFMASNSSTLADEDGEYSDWIELTNTGDAPVNLGGWFLTDDDQELQNWTLPAEVLDPGEYLVVFASNKNRAAAGQQLHTNWRMNADGEYLALVRPDGTVASEFNPFPVQIADVSYGTATLLETTPYVQATTNAKVHVPVSGTLGTTWTSATFDDQSWQNAVTGVGYATSGPVSQQSGFTVRMVQSGGAIGSATAAAAIVNGPGPWVYDASHVRATVNHGPGGSYAGDQAWPNGATDDSTSDFVIKATATVTIPAGNWTIGFSSDDGGYLRLGSVNFGLTHNESGPFTAGDNEIRFESPRGNAWTSGQITIPAGGITTTLEVVMFEDGGGDNLEIAIRNGHGDQNSVAAGTLLSDGAFTWQVKTNAAAPVPPFASLVQTSLQSQMYQQRTGAYLRIPFTVSAPPTADSLELRMKYDDGFVAYLNGVEIARSNVAAGTPAWNAVASSDR
ncbi:MAG: lamin tail domain-containing protein, partial [Pirellulales bacterium]